ncbi:LysR family transcriptional regulator [Saccharospirillum sp. HFRX-1]|uniref:LysR family transcriptional regulator n=1 Tax=unclassified Saccharospirillum TaxID=2633430 RepID=UPI003712777A
MPTTLAKTNNLLAWDDFRTVQAIAQSGSLAGAARHLTVSHATVFRRLNSIEQRLGVTLFERAASGYRPTVAGEAMAQVAAGMAAEVLALEHRLAGPELGLAGTIRLTTTDSLLSAVLTPMLADFREQHPGIELEVVAPSQPFNLSRREADLALRPSNQPPEHLVGRRVGFIRQAVYGRRDLGAQHQQWQELDWIGPDDSMHYRSLEHWLQHNGLAARYRTDTTNAMLAAVRSGLGAAVLPCYLADAYLGEQHADLMRLGEPLDALGTDLWLLTHPDLRHSARITALMETLAERLRSHPELGLD